MSGLFKLLFNKYYTQAYMKGYRLGLSSGLNQGKRLAHDEPAIVGTDTKMQRDIEDILRNKNF
jgi:hypothetical protein